ncbi:ribokinase [Acidaminobacter sp. JC074]|uniref:ribokinase n=1 Tax=Acidaminobacter sp. JC074 TaxID=2530199 RepID=UPI001F1068EB|nr:ribokinase [Acidaminobacter sp. JC074]
MKILNLGSINIDKLYKLQRFAYEGETIKVEDYSENPGGKGLNQSIAMTRAGTQVYHAGKVGKDGLYLKDFLDKQGINTDYLMLSDQATGHALIQVNEKGENSILVVGGANDDLDLNDFDCILSDFDKGDVLLLQNEVKGTLDIIDKAYEKNMIVVLNPSPITQTLKSLDLRKINYLIMNVHEALLLSEQDNIENAMTYFLSKNKTIKVVITRGGQGVIYKDSDQVVECDAINIEIVDTTGAGDTFLGYFMASMLSAEQVYEALELASKAASLAIGKSGAARSIPWIDEVNN